MTETDIDREKRLRNEMTNSDTQDGIATADLEWLLDRCERLRETVAMLSRSRGNRDIQFGAAAPRSTGFSRK